MIELGELGEGCLRGPKLSVERALYYTRAIENLEEYRDLIVRVAGWSSYFVALSREV